MNGRQKRFGEMVREARGEDRRQAAEFASGIRRLAIRHEVFRAAARGLMTDDLREAFAGSEDTDGLDLEMLDALVAHAAAKADGGEAS